MNVAQNVKPGNKRTMWREQETRWLSLTSRAFMFFDYEIENNLFKTCNVISRKTCHWKCHLYFNINL